MQKPIYLTLLFVLYSLYSLSQNNYDASKIPDNLKQDAVAVVRNEERFFEVKNLGTAQYNYKIALTILSKAGDEHSKMVMGYDKFSSLYNIKAAIYDASGKKIKDYKSADIRDQSASDGFSIYSDNRLKYLKFDSTTYPYTIEYSYSQDLKGILDYPSWQDINNFEVSLEQSTYTIQTAKGISFRYLTSPNLKTDSTKIGDKTLYIWKSKNQPAIIREPLSSGLKEASNWVLASSNDFEFDGTKGSLNNWKDFGMWFHKLNEGGNVLPEALKAKVQSLTKDATTTKDKIRILYNYLQQNTRYVSIQLGIGGFKPILAEKVAQVNYGDCKALSNYMKALLNEAGIQSNLVLIGNDMPSLNKNFASNRQSNHMILCVPQKNDTLFLECTSQYKPMGFIGYSNSDRDVLLITENGGQVVRTNTYNSKDNYQIRKTKISIEEAGVANITIKTNYGNAQFEDNFNLLLREPSDQRKAIINNHDIPGVELIGFKIEQADKTLPIMTDEINFKTDQLFTKGGEKLFLILNQTNRKESVPAKVQNRKTHFAVPYSYNDQDEISFILPKGYAVEFMPKDIDINSEFGTYTAKFSMKDNIITYTRTQTMDSKNYPPEKYNEYVDFYKKIYQADKLKAVLTKI
jgi:transglutaminase-like putative cysteine protease